MSGMRFAGFPEKYPTHPLYVMSFQSTKMPVGSMSVD